MTVAQQWLTLAIAVGSLAALLVAGYRGLRRWVQRVAVDVRKATEQLQTSGGTTVATYVEGTASDMADVRSAIGTLTARADANRDMAASALALARGAHERLDDHLLRHSEKV